MSVLLGQGNGIFQTAVSYAVGRHPQSVAVSDFNSDGKPDLAVANWESDNLSVLLNTCVSAGVGLAIVPNGTTVTVSWPFPSTGFVLESTTSLSLTNWQQAVEGPMTNNGRWEVATPANQRERYFRLRKP